MWSKGMREYQVVSEVWGMMLHKFQNIKIWDKLLLWELVSHDPNESSYTKIVFALCSVLKVDLEF